MTFAQTCFGSRRNHHQGAVLCLAKTTSVVFLLRSVGIFMFAPCVNNIKILFIVPTDAHYYKIVEMLKHLKL
jgi:hypothetical protein